MILPLLLIGLLQAIALGYLSAWAVKIIANSRDMRIRLKEPFLGLLTTGPMMGLFFIGLAGLFLQDSNFGPGHASLFAIISRRVWGFVAMSVAVAGYYGYFSKKRSAWLWAHSAGVVTYFVIGFLFLLQIVLTGVGAPFSVAMSMGLGLNAWVRGADLYKDRFPHD